MHGNRVREYGADGTAGLRRQPSVFGVADQRGQGRGGAGIQIPNVECDVVSRGIVVLNSAVDDRSQVGFSQGASVVCPGDRIDRVKVHNPRWIIVRIRRWNGDEQLSSVSIS